VEEKKIHWKRVSCCQVSFFTREKEIVRIKVAGWNPADI
jgi:hypothetical protein